MNARIILLVAFLSNGCIPYAIYKGLKQRHEYHAERAKVEAAVKANDYRTLEDMIDHLDYAEDNKLARTEYLRIRRANLAAASCDEVERELESHPGEASYATFGSYAADDALEKTIHDEALVKIADCKSPKLFSAHVLGSDDITGAQLTALERQGHPVLDAFLALAHSTEDDYVESATFTWLNRTKGAANCHAFEQAAADNDATRDFMLGFYTTKHCVPEAVRAARVLVSSRFASARLHACNAMKVLGNASLVPQMQILAADDTAQNLEWTAYEGWAYTFVVATSVRYPVREACQDALNELRTKTISRRE